MALPFFYLADYDPSIDEIELDEENSRHIIQVLRMKNEEELHLTDGSGHLLLARIIDDHKKKCKVQVVERTQRSPLTNHIIVAISLLKNVNRFEWFLEKATELGINEIIPLICHRTVKEKFRHDRMEAILVSAMLQSQQCWLPKLHQPISFELLLRQEEIIKTSGKFIAHCEDGDKIRLSSLSGETHSSKVILIGPEGDFTPEEIAFALQNHFVPVTLGETRLRTETAGMVAAALLRLS